MIQIKAPNPYKSIAGYNQKFKVFLGGSIDMGQTEPWQDKVVQSLSAYDDDLILLNPRRDDWDSSWLQDPTPGTQFHAQVSWEMSAQEESDLLIYYFAPGSQSPITFLELGTYGTSDPKSTIVSCSPDFYRYGNVVMMCREYGVRVVDSLDALILAVNEILIEEFYR